MAPWHLLEPREEDELHKSRLLNVEERPFKHITKRVQALHSAIARRGKLAALAPISPGIDLKQQNGVLTMTTATSQPSTPTTANVGGPVGGTALTSTLATEELEQLQEGLKIDFAAFDSQIARLQFLMTANAAERDRYSKDKQSILDDCQSVREKTAQLREQLESARQALERRKKFDDLAERITSNRMLKPRAEQRANLAKLEEECAQLEEESETYAVTWRERRDQFARIMEESMRLRRQIRDEKEEVDRREGMGDDEGADQDGSGGGGAGGGGGGGAGQTPRPGIASGNATPQASQHTGAGGPSLHPAKIAGLESQDVATVSRPGSTFGGRTPARDSPGPHDSLKPRPDVSGTFSGTFSHTGSRVASREGSLAPSPAAAAGDGSAASPNGVEEGEDVEMSDSVAGTQRAAAAGDNGTTDSTPVTDMQSEATPRITVESQDRMDIT